MQPLQYARRLRTGHERNSRQGSFFFFLMEFRNWKNIKGIKIETRNNNNSRNLSPPMVCWTRTFFLHFHPLPPSSTSILLPLPTPYKWHQGLGVLGGSGGTLGQAMLPITWLISCICRSSRTLQHPGVKGAEMRLWGTAPQGTPVSPTAASGATT